MTTTSRAALWVTLAAVVYIAIGTAMQHNWFAAAGWAFAAMLLCEQINERP